MHKQNDIFDRWYVRYPLAFFMLWAAWYLINMNKKPDLWWMAVLLAVPAAIYFARELSLVLVSIGVLYLFIKGIASLPISVAIIIGAIIIALAVRR